MKQSLNLLGHFHMFPPVHNAGSEATVLAVLRGLVKRGHKAKVIATEISESYTVDGVEVLAPPQTRSDTDQEVWKRALYSECDLALTHLNCTGDAKRCSKDTAKPLAHFIHNDKQMEWHNIRPISAQLLIFNSHWVLAENAADPALVVEPNIVVHPIVEPELYRVDKTGDRTTFVNLTVTKGANVFYELARRLPRIQFLGVRGAYGEQYIPSENIPNTLLLEHTSDIKTIYGMSRVVLMPSDYESYGRVAVEAACSGIPSIVHPTPGLVEALGDAAIYCDRNNVDEWEKELSRLYSDEEYYAERSAIARAFADSLEPEKELDRLETAFRLVVDNGLQNLASLTLEVLGEERYLELAKSGGYFDPAMESRNFRPALGNFPGRRELFVAEEELYLNSKNQVVGRSASDRVVKLIGTNGELPFERAYELGLIDANGGRLPVDGSLKAFAAAAETQAFSEPEETRAFSGPANTKAKKKRRAKSNGNGDGKEKKDPATV